MRLTVTVLGWPLLDIALTPTSEPAPVEDEGEGPVGAVGEWHEARPVVGFSLPSMEYEPDVYEE